MILRRLLQIVSLLIAVVLQFGAACSSTTEKVYYPPPGGGGGGYYPPPGGGGGDDRPNRIPRFADLVRDSKGQIRWTADMDGEIWVYDHGQARIVYAGPIRRGQELTVTPDKNLIWIDNQRVSNENLQNDARHQVYFARAGRGEPDRPPERPPGRDDLPPGARRLDSGSGNIDIDRAPGNGTVYVYDEDDHRVVYRHDINRGDSFQINLSSNDVTINRKPVDKVRLIDKHRHSLYFRDR